MVDLKLHLLGRAHRADVRAVAAILAFGCIDHIGAAIFGDGAFSAFRFASAASDAFIRVNLISHGFISPFWKPVKAINCRKNSTIRQSLSTLERVANVTCLRGKCHRFEPGSEALLARPHLDNPAESHIITLAFLDSSIGRAGGC